MYILFDVPTLHYILLDILTTSLAHLQKAVWITSFLFAVCSATRQQKKLKRGLSIEATIIPILKTVCFEMQIINRLSYLYVAYFDIVPYPRTNREYVLHDKQVYHPRL